MDRFDPALISVVMFCRNAAPTVEAAVASVLEQTYPLVQLVVVDDGSTDGASEILQDMAASHPDRIVLVYQNPAGPYAARNRALAHADGNYIAFLDADQVWHPDALRHLHAALETKGADLAYCGWQTLDAAAADAQPDIPPALDARAAIALFLEHGPWPIDCALARRPLIDELRGFSERAPTAMDYDFWLRLFAGEPKLVRVPEALASSRSRPRDTGAVPRWRQVFDAIAVRRDFARHYPQCVAHLPPARLDALIRGPLLREAYRCHWRNDTESARRLFRRALRSADWKAGDLKHLVASLLPAGAYRHLVDFVTHRRSARAGD